MIVTTTCIDVRFTAKNGDTPGSGKFERIEFSLGRWVTSSKKNAQIGEETCQLSRGTCLNFFSFTIVDVEVTFLKVILHLPKNVLISNFLIGS